MVFSRYFIAVVAIFITNVTFSVDWQELYGERDKILQEAIAENKLGANETLEKFIFLECEATKLYFNEQLEKVKDDAHHFTHSNKNIEDDVRNSVANIMQSNTLYALLSSDEIGVLDISKEDVPWAIKELSFRSPLALGPSPHEKIIGEDSLIILPEEIIFLRKNFPHAKYILFFDPRYFPTFNCLKAGLGHELAHTQNYHQIITRTVDYAARRLIEIDADLKNLCIKNENGIWLLRENSEQIIKDFYLHISTIDSWSKATIAKLMIGVDSTIQNETDKISKLLYKMKHLTHPLPNDRKCIMEDFVKIMGNFGGSMTDEEFNAVVGILTTWCCIYNNLLPLSEEFLQFIDLPKAKQLPRVQQYLKMPEVPDN